MNWDAEAEKIIEEIPLPPIMGRFARMDAERRALQRGLDTVTPAIAKAVEKGYERVFGKEATEVVRRMCRGDDVELPDEFFEDDDDELFKIEICPAKFGACTADKRDMIRNIVAPLRTLLKRLNTTNIILRKALTPLMSHHVLRVAVIGCPNCCMSPYFADIGIICCFRPEIREGCVQCGLCVKACAEDAVTLEDGQPVIDRERCIDCGACFDACPKDVIFIEKKGYKVVAGGSGSRHPQLARTVTPFTDFAGVMRIVEQAVLAYRDYPQGNKEVSFHGMIAQAGAEFLAS
ncbi:MAG: 4Fe-4S dicluster domain-containing protein [Deltaproteobacteria bacterium]|nr:4Fe-4S dicluster domain-containing protein [Deltaproteobacteria bacterium]